MRAVGICALALLAACASGAENDTNMAGANAANPAGASRPCPEEELSCGRQRPVVSDGVTPFVNETMSLSAVFPAGSEVCMTRSGDEPRGFFAVYGVEAGCPERPARPPRFIMLNAMFNTPFHTNLEIARGAGCGPLSAGTRRRLGAAPLAMPGFPTLACERRAEMGAIEIELNFLGGPWQIEEGSGGRSRSVFYTFSLGTTDSTFDEDLARFRRVLASVRISER